MRHGGRTFLVGVACVSAAGGLAGCHAFSEHRAGLEQAFAAGRFDQAAMILDDPKTHKMYGAKNELLWKLDRGAVALAMGDSDRAVDLLNQAEAVIEVREKTKGDEVAQWVVNDTAAPYVAEPYEDIYINVIKLMAQLAAGRIDGGATVEARRLGSKADVLRERWLKYEGAVAKKGGAALAGAERGGGGLGSVNNRGQFIESTLGTYLSAVTFMKSGDREFQRVASKRLVDSIRLQRGLIGPVREEDFQGLDEAAPEAANLLVVALSGRGPTKYAEGFGPIPLGTIPIYFELPYLRTYPSEAVAARVELDGQTGNGRALPLVEDLSAVAAENHRRALPGIQARTIVRAMVKSGISAGLTELARRQARDRNQGWVQLAGVLGGLAVLATTEQADLRCWVFLPGQARVGLMKLVPGTHTVRVVYEGARGGEVYATAWKTVEVSENGLTSVVGQYWR